jgi:drug/metabolite transporter (DMT)-like permease
MLLFFKGLAITTPINAAILMVTTPLFVAFFSFFLLNEKVTKLKVIGLCFGVFGAILLLLGPSLSFNSSTLWGDVMVMTNAIIYAYYLIIAKPLLHKYSPLTVIKWTFFFGGLLVIPFGFTELKEVQWQAIPNSIWSAIIFLIIGATYITYVLNAWALRNANATLVGAYIYLQPVLATIIAVSIGKDSLTLPKVLFSLLIFIGVYLVGLPNDAKSKI